ncbi:MAG TPA: nitrogen fixation protein NifQ [Rhodocyclaceae bacterium]|nr:nitrogen fixation protein NifQ [Rhodocyclaceae bacterium]
MDPIGTLLSQARRPDDLATIAIAGVVGMSLRRGRQPLISGLSEARFQKLLNEYFVGIALSNGEAPASIADEFDDILELLLEHRAEPTEPAAWLAHAVASAAMGENHLWQDMGLPSRKHLSALLQAGFPTLAARNTGDMKWKKFFYRQLCERAEVPICKSPHCAECCDYGICFGPE